MLAENREVEGFFANEAMIVQTHRTLEGIGQNLLQNNLSFSVSCFQLMMAFVHSYSCKSIFVDKNEP